MDYDQKHKEKASCASSSALSPSSSPSSPSASKGVASPQSNVVDINDYRLKRQLRTAYFWWNDRTGEWMRCSAEMARVKRILKCPTTTRLYLAGGEPVPPSSPPDLTNGEFGR